MTKFRAALADHIVLSHLCLSVLSCPVFHYIQSTHTGDTILMFTCCLFVLF